MALDMRFHGCKLGEPSLACVGAEHWMKMTEENLVHAELEARLSGGIPRRVAVHHHKEHDTTGPYIGRHAIVSGCGWQRTLQLLVVLRDLTAEVLGSGIAVKDELAVWMREK